MNNIQHDWLLGTWMELCPFIGWSDFSESQIVADLIWRSLSLKEHGGVWGYLNFTSSQSVWEADDCKDGSQFLLEFDSSEDDARIVRMLTKLGGTESTSFSQLTTLLTDLRSEFGITFQSASS